MRNCSNFIVKHAAEPNRDIGHPSTTINSSSYELPLAGFTTVAQSFPNGLSVYRHTCVGTCWLDGTLHSLAGPYASKHCRPLRSLNWKVILFPLILRQASSLSGWLPTSAAVCRFDTHTSNGLSSPVVRYKERTWGNGLSWTLPPRRSSTVSSDPTKCI